MEFETEEAEKAYKQIVNQQGLGYVEILSRPQGYSQALKENETVRPQDLDKNDQALRALQILEEAGFLKSGEEYESFEVNGTGDEVYDEVFSKLEEKRDYLI